MRGRPSTCFAVALLLAACGEAPPPEWHQADGYRWRDLDVARRGAPGFETMAARRSGVDFVNEMSRESALGNRHLTHGSGVALGDVDGDGLADLFLARMEGPNALYRNLGGWRFEDITGASGLAADDRMSTGAVFADVDGDRDADLILSALGGTNSVFLNDGAGVFQERPLLGGEGRGSTTIALADVEGDGDLDLYIANYKMRSAMDSYPPEERTFDRIVREVDGEYLVAEGYETDFRVVERPDLGVVAYTQRAESDVFYRNDGAGGFEHIRFDSGVFLDEDGRQLSEEPDLFGLTARFYDVNGDRAPDLFVANDFEDPDNFWLNQGDGTFRAAPRLSLRTTSNAGMAVDFADIDRDGDVDFFEVDMLSSERGERLRQVPTHTALPKQVGAIDDRPQMMRNTLFVNRGDATFAQVAELAGVDATGWSWGTLFMDVDLDGFEDILVTNGHLWDIMDGDTKRRLGTLDYDWRREFLLFPPLAQSNVALRNGGALDFEDVSALWGFGDAEDVSHGIATADLDMDGDLDVVVTRLNDAPLLLRNRSAAPRIAVTLNGRAPNTAGVGALVRLTEAGGLPQEKEVASGGMYLSGSAPTVSLAAPEGGERDLEVTWRDGSISLIENVSANRHYEVAQPARPGSTAATAATDAEPFFEDVSHLLAHEHFETPFADGIRQPLLPNGLDRLGPGVTWYDVDGDGFEDLLLPSGRGGALAHYRNVAGEFSRVRSSEIPAVGDQTTALPLPDGAGGTMVMVGQSNYESASPAEALGLPSAVAPPSTSGLFRSLPGDTSSVGVLVSADVDSDGDLDVFVGARVLAAAYPMAGSSRLYLNTGDGFEEDVSNAGALGGLGMVSSATFSDVDGDGDPDLLLAVEWGSLILMFNDDGRFRRADDSWGLGPSARWNGVATGDLDGDGRLDIVATGWGRNTRYSPAPDRPVVLYFGDLDRNGSFDLVRAQRDPDLENLFPLDRIERLSVGIPRIGQSVSSMADFSRATLLELFGGMLQSAGRFEARTYDHTLFLNRGDHFEAVALPLEAQFAPAFHVGVTDFDGDGNEDVFLSQNFFPTEQGTSRLDGGRSLWLRGDGAGGLEPVSGSESGVRVWGDGRGAAFSDFDADGRVDLAVAQNGAATKLFRNVGARAGLRVRLVGPDGNPHGFGSVLRLVYEGRLGPAREVRLGSGYWSADGAVQVLGGVEGATAVRVKWPDGIETEVPFAPADGEVAVRHPAVGS